MKTHVINHWFHKLLSALALIGLLFCGNAQAQIGIQDGNPLAIQTAKYATTNIIWTNFTVTANASVLVVSLFTRDNDSTTDPFVGHVTYGSTPLTQGVWTNNAGSTYAVSDIYYLFNPPAGTQNVTATDSTGTAGAMAIQAYTLNKVSTTVTPSGYFTNSPSALSLTFALANVPISGALAVNTSFGTGGQTITNVVGGVTNILHEFLSVSNSSGTTVTVSTNNTIVEAMGYVDNVNPGANTMTAAPQNYAGTPNKFAFVALAFTPSSFTPPPTNVVAASGQTSMITVSWNDSSGGVVTNWVVERSPTSGGPYTAIFTNSITLTTPTNYIDTSVVNYTTYYYVVQAEGPAGESADSTEVSASSVGPLPAPTGLLAQPLNGQVGLVWNPVPGATGYNVLEAASSGGPYSTIASPATALYTNTSLANGTTYYYEVNAVNGFGPGTDSPYVSATPAIPNAGIYLHDGGIFSTQTVVNGAVFPAVTNVSIIMPFEVSPGANTMVAELLDHNGDDTTNGSPSSIIWSNATLGTTQVLTRAVSQNQAQYSYEDCDLFYVWNPSPGVGTLSCTDTYTNGSVADHMLLQVYTLSGVDTTANGGVPYTASAGANQPPSLQVTVTPTTNWAWAAAMSVNYAGGGGYIDTNTATSGTSVCYNFGFTGNQNCLGWIANLLAGTTTITATFSLAEHSALAVEAFQPLPGGTPAPINVAVTGGTNSAQLTWSSVSGATSYTVYRSSVSGSGYLPIATLGITKYTDNGLPAWTNYFYEVIATGPNAASLPSSPDATTTPGGLAPQITGLTATNGILSVLLNWSDLGATNFNVLRAPNTAGNVPGTFSQVANVNVNASYSGTNGGYAYTNAGTEAALYYYEIAPVNFYGTGSVSSVVSAIPCVTFFTNWISIPVDSTCVNGWVSNGVADAQYPDISAAPAPSLSYLVLDGWFGFTTTNDFGSLTTNLTANLSTYTEMQVDITAYLFDQPAGEIQAVEFFLGCNGTNFQFYNAAGTAANYYDAMTNGQINLTAAVNNSINAHYSCPMNSLTNANTALVTSLELAVLDSLNTSSSSVADSNNEDVGFANIEFDGAPGYTPMYLNLNNPTIGPGTASVGISGTVGSPVGAGTLYLAQGTMVTVTVAGLSAQPTTISDATGDFLITYTGTTGLGVNTYAISVSSPSDNVSFVAGANATAGTLTVTTVVPPPPPRIPAPRLNAAGTSLLVTPGGNTASGSTYYLLQTTNLSPPVVWTTNTSFAGTGAPVTNSVPLNSARDIFLEYKITTP